MAYAGNESDDWPNLINNTKTSSLVNFQQFAQTDSLGSITVHAHDLVCSGLDLLKNREGITVVTKISIFPTPGKSKIVRSSGSVSDDGTASFPFRQQAVELNMSTADMRGRAYAQGYSPLITVEVSIDNKTYVGRGEIYLPGLFTLLEDDVITLPIQLSGDTPGFEQASFLLDVKCHPVGQIVKRRRPQSVTLWTFGLTNKAIKGGSMQVSLSCADESGRELQPLQDVKVVKKMTEFENYFQLTSIWPEGDVLTIRIFDEKDNEYGHVLIPMSAILNGAVHAKMAHRVWALNGKEVSAVECFLICSTECTDTDDVETDLGIKKAAISEQTDGPQFNEELANAAATVGVRGTPEPLNSLGGRLMGCVQGFTCEDSAIINGRQRYIAEVCLHPTEGSAEAPWAQQTQACAPHAVSKTRHGVEWGKSFELPIAYALQQRYALHLTIQLFEESSKGGKKRCLGEACFDIVSLVSVRDNEIMTFFLPVFSPDTAKLIPSARKEVGKFVISVQFTSEKVFVPGSTAQTSSLNNTANLLGTTKTFGTTNLSALSDTRGSQTPGKSPGRSVATAVGLYAGTQQSAAGATRIGSAAQASHSEVANASLSFWQALMADELKESAVDVFIQFNPVYDASNILARFGDNLSLVVDSMAESFDTKLLFEDFEDTLVAAENAKFKIMTQAKETAVALNVCFGRDGNACCECWVVLSKASLVMGLPIQFDLPLRDSHGLKVAVLRLGSHTSSPELCIQPSVDALRVTFVEGNVSDPTWANPLELYFECTLVAHRDYQGDVSQVYQGRTSWVSGLGRKSKEVDVAKMQCTMDLPLDATPEMYLKRIPSGAPTWSLTIVGRDASRPGAPALITGNVNLSWALLIKGKTMQERFILKNAATGRNIPVSLQIEKIKKGSGGTDAGSDGFEGVGSALIWMHGAQFPREDLPAQIDNAEVSVRWSMGNALSGQPFGGDDEQEEHNNDDIASAMFAKVASIQQSRGDNSRPLVASVPLPGGYADLKLSVSCGDSMYSTLLPALAAVSKLDASNILNYPKFNVMLSKDGAKPARGDPASSPRLQFSMMYVPYVVGKLIFSIQDVRMEMLPGSWVQQPGNKKAALRFTIGTLTNKFTNQFTIKEVFNSAPPSKGLTKAKASTASLFGDQTENSKSTSKFRKNMNKTNGTAVSGVPIMPKTEIIEIPMNTFDLMNSPGADGQEEPLDLHCAVLDLSGLQGNDSSPDAQLSYVRAIGAVQTASLYYQAMRDAIAQPPTVSAGQARGGCSPEVPVTIPLHHPGTGEVIGTVHGSMKFQMFGAAEDVIADIALHIKQAGNFEATNSECGAELGLKQAYTAADKDNSGGISKTELISVFMAIKAESKRGRNSIVGLDENAIKALVDLINVLDNDDTNEDENALEVSDDQFKGYLEEFFQKLDLDGDGTVSWWEWRQVLYAASLMRNKIAVKFMDHLDPLIVSYLAAHHGLEVLRQSDPGANLPTTTADLNSYRNISWGDGSKRGETDKLLEELRKKNKELEDALRNAGHGNDAEANARIRIAREEADAAKRLLDAERARSNRLQSEIDGMAGVSRGRADLEDENRKARARLLEQGAKSKERIALAHWQRKKKAHAIEMIRRALLKWINKHRRKKLTAEDIDGLMTNIMGNLAATRIQKMYRGKLGRARAKEHWHAIAVIQSFCRQRKEIRARRSEFANFVHEMVKASTKIQSAFRKSQLKRKGNQKKKNMKQLEAEHRAALMAELAKRSAFIRAATKIQSSFRARLAWKELMARLSGTKVDVVNVIPADKPVLIDAIRYWIRLGVNKKGDPRQGFVNDINIANKELNVVFEDSSNMKEEIVSYDDPKIMWFEETGVLVEKDGVPKKMNVANMYDIWLQAANKPALGDAKHYWVRVNNDPKLKLSISPRSIERQYFYGYVSSVDKLKKTISVFFDELNRRISIPYSTASSDLRWYHELHESDAKKIIRELDGKEEEITVPVSEENENDDEIWLQEIEKPKLNVALNHWVQAINIPSVSPNKSVYGIVASVDDANKQLRVYFDELGVEKVVPYHTSKLRWYEAMTSQRAEGILRMLDSSSDISTYSSRKNQIKSTSSNSPRSSRVYDFMCPVEKPPLEDAPNGYYIRITGKNESDVVEGRVVSVEKKTMKIQAIVNGSLTNDFHNNVPYTYRDVTRMKWYKS